MSDQPTGIYKEAMSELAEMMRLICPVVNPNRIVDADTGKVSYLWEFPPPYEPEFKLKVENTAARKG